MATAMKVQAQARTGQGTSQARRVRREGNIPGIVYGVGKTPLNVQVNARAFTRSLHAQSSEHVMMDLAIGESDVRKVLLQDVQHHPISGDIIHADFHEISLTEKLRVRVPVRLVGEPVGVSQSGGVLEFLVREVEIECLPMDIPEHLDLDVSGLNVGQGFKAGDIPLDPAKLRLIAEKDLAIAAVSAQRAEEEVAAPAAAATAEPEVLREKKPEEGEAAAGGKGEAKAGGEKKEEKKPAAKEAKK